MLVSKPKSNSRFGYSEEKMGEEFQTLLRSNEGLPGIGVFDAVYGEILCLQGRPDFIALRYSSDSYCFGILNVSGLIEPSILSALKPKAPRTLEYLSNNLEFTRDSIKRSLRALVEKGYVDQTEGGTYRLSQIACTPNPEIWSFELKLNNPKKAVFQAQQSRAFAERAIIVVPPGQERNYERFYDTMRRWHIGLATFDPVSKKFKFERKGRTVNSLSKRQKMYTLSQLPTQNDDCNSFVF